MKRKVLGLLLFLLAISFIGCENSTTEAETTSEAATTAAVVVETTSVTIEVYIDGDNPATEDIVEVSYLLSETVEYTVDDTLFDLMNETFSLGCGDASFSLDETCSYASEYGHYIMKIEDFQPVNGLVFTKDSEPVMVGVDFVELTDDAVFRFSEYDVTEVEAFGTISFEIITTGDDPATTEVEEKYVSNSLQVEYLEGDLLADLLDDNFRVVFSDPSEYGRMINELDTLVPVSANNEFITFLIDGVSSMTGIDSTPVEDGKTYTFEIATW